MKSLILIWILAILSALSFVTYFNTSINKIVAQSQADGLYMYSSNDLQISKPELYTVTSFNTVKLQVTASDAYHQWGASSQNISDDRTEVQTALGYKAFQTDSRFILTN